MSDTRRVTEGLAEYVSGGPLAFRFRHPGWWSTQKIAESAEVCAGGVDVREIDAKTLMSHKINNLYFCGEVLDVDGGCGGFNLHFAWASGYLVGHSL